MVYASAEYQSEESLILMSTKADSKPGKREKIIKTGSSGLTKKIETCEQTSYLLSSDIECQLFNSIPTIESKLSY